MRKIEIGAAFPHDAVEHKFEASPTSCPCPRFREGHRTASRPAVIPCTKLLFRLRARIVGAVGWYVAVCFSAVCDGRAWGRFSCAVVFRVRVSLHRGAHHAMCSFARLLWWLCHVNGRAHAVIVAVPWLHDVGDCRAESQWRPLAVPLAH